MRERKKKKRDQKIELLKLEKVNKN